MGLMHPQAPDARGWGAGRLQPQRGRGFPRLLGSGEWPCCPQPSLRCGPWASESSEGQPHPVQPVPTWTGAKTLYSKGPRLQLPCKDFPPPGTLGEAPGAASALTPASELDVLWAAPVPRGQTGPDCPCLQDPRDPRDPWCPSPVTGPSQYTWTYSSRLWPEQRKVTEAASAGFRKADVRGPAAGECRHQSWPPLLPAGPPTPTSAVARAGLGGAARLHPHVPWGHREAGRPEVRQQLDRRVS